ncbi:uncharacterized protein METZ01_LOCUS269734, partial [marine metagenome]
MVDLLPFSFQFFNCLGSVFAEEVVGVVCVFRMSRNSLINKSEITKATLDYFKMKTTNKILANNLLY